MVLLVAILFAQNRGRYEPDYRTGFFHLPSRETWAGFASGIGLARPDADCSANAMGLKKSRWADRLAEMLGLAELFNRFRTAATESEADAVARSIVELVRPRVWRIIELGTRPEVVEDEWSRTCCRISGRVSSQRFPCSAAILSGKR